MSQQKSPPELSDSDQNIILRSSCLNIKIYTIIIIRPRPSIINKNKTTMEIKILVEKKKKERKKTCFGHEAHTRAQRI